MGRRPATLSVRGRRFECPSRKSASVHSGFIALSHGSPGRELTSDLRGCFCSSSRSLCASSPSNRRMKPREGILGDPFDRHGWPERRPESLVKKTPQWRRSARIWHRPRQGCPIVPCHCRPGKVATPCIARRRRRRTSRRAVLTASTAQLARNLVSAARRGHRDRRAAPVSTRARLCAGQGLHFSRPVPASEIEALYRASRSDLSESPA